MVTRISLSVCLISAAVFASSVAQAFDRSSSNGGACAQQSAAERCVAAATMPATAPETTVYGALSDHDAGYDAQGNPVDRQGNVIATQGRSGNREVFAQERTRR